MARPEPASQAQAIELTTVARDGDCPSGKRICLVMEDATPQLAEGDRIRVTFRNELPGERRLHVTTKGRADRTHAHTPASVAIASSDPAPSGEEAVLVTGVPTGENLYLYCTGEDEAAGLWLELPVGTSDPALLSG